MKYYLDINPSAFEAIKEGRKTIEGRTPTSHNNIDYKKMKKGDNIEFVNYKSKEKLKVEVVYVKQYKDAKTMLESEGKDKILSNYETIKEGVNLYHSFPEYKENIVKYGIFAIKIKKI